MSADWTPFEFYFHDKQYNFRSNVLHWVDTKTGKETPMKSLLAEKLEKKYPELCFIGEGIMNLLYKEYVSYRISEDNKIINDYKRTTGKSEYKGYIRFTDKDKTEQIQDFDKNRGEFLLRIEETIKKVEKFFEDNSKQATILQSSYSTKAKFPESLVNENFDDELSKIIYDWFRNESGSHYSEGRDSDTVDKLLELYDIEQQAKKNVKDYLDYSYDTIEEIY